MFGRERSFLCLISAWILTTAHCAEEASDIASSLQCTTDYITKIDCQWAENSVARRYIPMELYYKKETLSSISKYSEQKCNLRRLTNTSSPDINWGCTIKDGNYAVSYKYSYVFKPERPLILTKSFRLLETIKPQPPLNLSVAVTEKGDYLLTWQTIYTNDSSNMLFGKLQYEINYRRSWESWENSIMETVSDDDRRFQISKFFPATSDMYIARVRTKPQYNSSYTGIWSAWSSELQWGTTENTNVSQAAEAEVMPRNLQCAYDGIQAIECTWEVTRESSKYFEFKLHFAKGNSSETKECNPSVIHHTFSHLTVHRCNIPVNGQEALDNYKVLLKLTEPAKTINPFKNIKVNAPFNLTITQQPEGVYQLDWLTMKAIYKSEYEIYYKKFEEPWENAKVVKKPQGNNSHRFQKVSLQSSCKYSVRIRAKVIDNEGDPYSYLGPWSDWSKEVTLETDFDFQLLVATAYAMPLILILLIPPFICLIKRKKRSWLDSIPDPAKSKLFQRESQRGLLVHPTPMEAATLEESNICQVVTNESSDTPCQVIPKKKAELTQSEERPDISPPLMTRGRVGQEQLYRDIGTAAETVSYSGEEFPRVPTQQSEPFDFNGPYLFNYQDFSLALNSLSELNKGLNKNASYFKNGQGAPGYVKLPHIVSEGLQDGEQGPPLPTFAYVLNPSQPQFSSPLTSSATGYHVHTDWTATDCLRPSALGQPSASTSSYVLCPPLVNSVPTSSPEVIAGYNRTKDTDISGSDKFAVGQRPTASNREEGPLPGCNIPTAEDENARDSQGCRHVPQEDPAGTPWQPCAGGYVLTPPGEQVVRSSAPPEPPKSGNLKDWSLSADHHQAVGSEASVRTKAVDYSPELPYPSKFQEDARKPTAKEQQLQLSNLLENEGPNVILYQQGAKPILLQQIGDYCFIPGSCPTKTNEFTKCHASSSLANAEPANKHSVFHEDLKGKPQFQSPYTTGITIVP
uniref:cytokine receptor common subunit beta-like n=1 Tax=Pristiophorus japonicus TaxID=55135 RepID=UPI00398E9ECE